jgi:2-polyprenyl-3-methyl-5-hydroxy-6-metoxy-1,4-benzoquinol methylase
MSAPSRDLDDYARHYANAPFEAIQARYRRRVVLEQVRRHHPRRLLEVGCGVAPLFVDLPNTACAVVEPTAEFHALATRMAEGRSDVEVHRLPMEDYAPSQPFDVVVVSGLLHEVLDPKAVLKGVKRCCSAATWIHVNVPNALSLHRLLAVAMGVIASPDALSDTQRRLQQFRTFDAAQLRQLLESTGFEVAESGSYFVKPFTHAQMQRLVDDGFLTEAMIDGLARLTDRLPLHGSEIFANARLRHA